MLIDTKSQEQPDIEEKYEKAKAISKTSIAFNLPIYVSRTIGGTVWLKTIEDTDKYIVHSLILTPPNQQGSLEHSLFVANNRTKIFIMYGSIIKAILEKNGIHLATGFLQMEAYLQVKELNRVFKNLNNGSFSGVMLVKQQQSPIQQRLDRIVSDSTTRALEVQKEKNFEKKTLHPKSLKPMDIVYLGDNKKLSVSYFTLIFDENRRDIYLPAIDEVSEPISVNYGACGAKKYIDLFIVLPSKVLKTQNWVSEKVNSKRCRNVFGTEKYMLKLIQAYIMNKGVTIQSGEAYAIPKALCNTVYYKYIRKYPNGKPDLVTYLYDFMYEVGEGYSVLQFREDEGFFIKYKVRKFLDIDFLKHITSDYYLTHPDKHGDITVPLTEEHVLKTFENMIESSKGDRHWFNLSYLNKEYKEGTFAYMVSSILSSVMLTMNTSDMAIALSCPVQYLLVPSDGSVTGLVAAYSLYRFYIDADTSQGEDRINNTIIKAYIEQSGIPEAIRSFIDKYKNNDTVIAGMRLIHMLTEPKDSYIFIGRA